jgi:hypothetical protein
MLKALTWFYVIYNPALATQQFAQRKIITELFQVIRISVVALDNLWATGLTVTLDAFRSPIVSPLDKSPNHSSSPDRYREVLVLYLKRPRVKFYRSDAL